MTGPCDLSLILVAHHSSRLLPGAVTAFRREAAANGASAEVVVVEHSGDAVEVERARQCAPDTLLVRANTGYAAGVNAGIGAARGRWLLVGNPDVELGHGALAPLLSALAGGWDLVGPQLELAGFLFPPADVQTPRAEAGRRLALRSRRTWRRHLGTELSRWWPVWEATAPARVPTLSGALLVFSASLAARVGPWDEGYFLYFEETDWIRRAVRQGMRPAVVPAARATHRWGHSARPEAWEDRFAASQRRFYGRWYPRLGPLALGVKVGSAPVPHPWSEAPAGDAWRWLLSPSPAGFPAALLADDRPVQQAALAFCRACERPGVTLVGWNPRDGGIAGPFALSGHGAAAAP